MIKTCFKNLKKLPSPKHLISSIYHKIGMHFVKGVQVKSSTFYYYTLRNDKWSSVVVL